MAFAFIVTMPKSYSRTSPSTRIEVKDSKRYFLRLKTLRLKEPDNVELSYEIGNYLYSIKSYDEAIKEYRRTLRIDPEHEYAKWFLSKTLVEKKYYDEAFGLVRELIIKHKKQPELYDYAGEILLKMDKPKIADEYFAKCDQLLYGSSGPTKLITNPNGGAWKKYFY
jgi:tetratricopeptide (TPR) repeat protein